MKKIQTNTVSASGAMKLRSPCTMDFDWDSTISTRISTAAWKRPGTPDVALARRLGQDQDGQQAERDRPEECVKVEY
jgi:hypothetical protein